MRTGSTSKSGWAPVALASAISSAAVLLLIFWHGLDVTWDSATYLYTAQSLLGGRGYQGADGSHMVDFPPAYPALLAATMFLTGASAETAAVIVSVVSVFAGVLGFGAALLALLRRDAKSGWVLAGALVFGLSFTVTQVSTAAWSEPPFLALIVWAAALQVDPERASRGRVAIIGLLLAAAILTRTAGAFAVGAAILVYLVRRQYKRAAFVGVLGLAPAAVWAVVNAQLGSAETVERGASADAPVYVVSVGLRWMAQWFSFGFGPTIVQVGTAVIVGGAILVACVLGFRDWRRLTVPAIYFVALAVGTFGTRIFVALNPLGPRLLAPLLPFALLCVVVALALNRWRRVSAGLLVVLLAATVSATIDQERTGATPGDKTALAESACALIPEGAVVSNEPSILAFECQRPVDQAPRQNLFSSTRQLDEMPALRDLVRDECVSVVYFQRGANDFHEPLEALRAELNETNIVNRPELAIDTTC